MLKRNRLRRQEPWLRWPRRYGCSCEPPLSDGGWQGLPGNSDRFKSPQEGGPTYTEPLHGDGHVMSDFGITTFVENDSLLQVPPLGAAWREASPAPHLSQVFAPKAAVEKLRGEDRPRFHARESPPHREPMGHLAQLAVFDSPGLVQALQSVRAIAVPLRYGSVHRRATQGGMRGSDTMN
jgi:hypothetical protein